MPFNPTYGIGGWVAGTSTPATATAMNDRDQQYGEATQSWNPDLFTPFVLWGCSAAKDGTIMSQLDVTAGVYYALQSDNTLRRRSISATNYSTTVASTTYYLDANPDGTFSWGTSHSSQSNYLPLCQVTTDSSANILVVTDERNFNMSFLSGSTNGTTGGKITFPGGISLGGHVYAAVNSSGGNQPVYEWANTASGGHTWAMYITTANGFNLYDATSAVTVLAITSAGVATIAGSVTIGGALSASSGSLAAQSQQSGSASGIYFESWSGTAGVTPFSIGGQYNSALAYIDNSGDLYAVAGTFSGTIAGKTLTLKPTANNDAIVLCDSAGTIGAAIGNASTGFYVYDEIGGAFALQGITKTANVMTNRSGTVQANTVFTGTSTPTAHQVGDIWLNQ